MAQAIKKTASSLHKIMHPVTGNSRTVISMMFLVLMLSLMSGQLAFGQNAKSKSNAAEAGPTWIYPAIPKFGGVHPRPELPVRPDPKVNYRIFVDVISTNSPDSTGRFLSLIRLARLVNLMAYSKVPNDHVHIVALLDGKSGFAAARNDYYQKNFHRNNPNLSIVHALKKAGVKLLICSQALAEHNIADDVVDPDVTITLSALTDAVIYGQKGYIYMQL